MNTLEQQQYFDIDTHRHDKLRAAHPPLAQQYELKAMELALALKPGSTIIDFGAGNGRVGLYFLKHGYHVIAVDISSESLQSLSSIYQQTKGANWGKLRVSNKLPKKSVDGLVGADVLHHVNIQDTLQAIYPIIKPGGRVVFSEPNAWHLPWYLHYFLSRIPWRIEKGILQCTLSNLTRLFTNTFSDVSIQGHGLLPTTPLSMIPMLCKHNALFWGDTAVTKPLAFRFIIKATK